VAAGLWRDEAVGGDVGEDFGGGVGGTGAQAGDLHGEEVVDVVAEEAGVVEGDVEFCGEVAECGGLVAGAFDDEGDVHLFGVVVDEGRGFAGDESHLDAEAAEQRDAHDVGEGEGFGFLAGGRPGEGAVGEDAVNVEGDGLQGGEGCGVEGHAGSVGQCLLFCIATEVFP
jgi:hypothetical protein